jgi:hypothetical protein
MLPTSVLHSFISTSCTKTHVLNPLYPTVKLCNVFTSVSSKYTDGQEVTIPLLNILWQESLFINWICVCTIVFETQPDTSPCPVGCVA